MEVKMALFCVKHFCFVLFVFFSPEIAVSLQS